MKFTEVIKDKNEKREISASNEHCDMQEYVSPFLISLILYTYIRKESTAH